MTNHCGTCTACCRTFAVPTLNKPAGKWCQHCAIGKGCTIYEQRPKPCLNYECLWLQSQRQPNGLDIELRPDKCKVVFSQTTNPHVVAAFTAPHSPDAWRRPLVRKLIDIINKAGTNVAVGECGATSNLMFAADGSIREVKLTAPDKDGMQWSVPRKEQPL